MGFTSNPRVYKPPKYKPEDLDKIISKARKQQSKSQNVINKNAIFDFSYIPRKILIREETKSIVENIVSFDMHEIPNNLFIFGSRGSGKTLLLKYIKDFPRLRRQIKVPIIYINCRYHNTSFKVLSEILPVRSKGLGTHELYKKLTEQYDKLLIILDEIDLISQKEKTADILYYLSRSEKKYMVILLSNNPNFYNRIDLPTKSSLQLEKMFFRNYNAEEIGQILEMRCKEGLSKYRKKDLALIAALTTKECNGDVRVALKTLQYVITKKYDDIQKNFERARDDIYIDLLNDQNEQVIIILSAIQKSKERLVKSIYETYKALCLKFEIKPFTYMHFYNHLSYLQSMGLILLIATNLKSGNPNRVELLFDTAVLNHIRNLRMGR